ncbi:MAG: HEAT repeat domain-containing protein [Planctomycetota bacterium]
MFAGRILTSVLALTAALHAHGGQYRGPGSGPPPPVTPGGGPATGPKAEAATGTNWQAWWEHNKEELLQPRNAIQGPISGSDEFYLGVRRSEDLPGTQLPTDADRRDLIAAALQKTLQDSSDRDVTTACMIGLAKVGVDVPPSKLSELFALRLREPNQEVRETAALALGIAGLQDAFPALAALLRGDNEGRKLAGGREEVPERSRTFAAWSLGLLAGRSTDAKQKQRTFELLSKLLADEGERSRDLRVGLIHALGLIAPDPERSAAERMLLYRIVDALWAFYERDLGKGNQLVQAHVPTAVVRLLGRGNAAAHQRAKERMVAELVADGRSNQIRESAALALGALCLPQEECPADAECAKALVQYYQTGTDQQTRYFAIAALGRIGGEANRKALLRLYPGTNRATERPWVAIALGLIARQRMLADSTVVDAELGRMLLEDLRDIDVDTTRAGIALALGLCVYEPAGADIRALLASRTNSDTAIGYVTLSLAMLGDRAAVADISDLMRRSLRRPFVLQQCALALGSLGDTSAVPVLVEMLSESESTATLAAIASALGELRDRRAIEPLLRALRDKDRSMLGRAFVAAALGGVGDKDALRWNAAIARDVNYGALVDTLGNGSTGVLDIL